MVFWFGDLNFRIDDLEMQVVKSAIDNNKFSILWEKDQVKPNIYMYAIIVPQLICMWPSSEALKVLISKQLRSVYIEILSIFIFLIIISVHSA